MALVRLKTDDADVQMSGESDVITDDADVEMSGEMDGITDDAAVTDDADVQMSGEIGAVMAEDADVEIPAKIYARDTVMIEDEISQFCHKKVSQVIMARPRSK